MMTNTYAYLFIFITCSVMESWIRPLRHSRSPFFSTCVHGSLSYLEGVTADSSSVLFTSRGLVDVD